jgi:nicotinamidase-related amidase
MPMGALLVVDVQRGMFESALIPPVHGGELLLARVGELLARARAAHTPVIFVQHAGGAGDPLEPGTPGFELHAALARRPDEPVVVKRFPDSFQDTELAARLAALGVRELVVAGMQTEFCVDTTCRRAFSLGYQVTLAGDAHATWPSPVLSAEQIVAHHNQLLAMGFATVVPSAQVRFAAS